MDGSRVKGWPEAGVHLGSQRGPRVLSTAGGRDHGAWAAWTRGSQWDLKANLRKTRKRTSQEKCPEGKMAPPEFLQGGHAPGKGPPSPATSDKCLSPRPGRCWSVSSGRQRPRKTTKLEKHAKATASSFPSPSAPGTLRALEILWAGPGRARPGWSVLQQEVGSHVQVIVGRSKRFQRVPPGEPHLHQPGNLQEKQRGDPVRLDCATVCVCRSIPSLSQC